MALLKPAGMFAAWWVRWAAASNFAFCNSWGVGVLQQLGAGLR